MDMRVYFCLWLFVDLCFGSRVIIVENAPTCFRRVLAGKRALRSFVRRVVPCERLEDCRRECATEKRFHCESFNYKLDPSFRGKGLCELMTKPIEAFDVQRDFVEDKNYDFYEIDRNSLEPHCPENLRGSGQLHSGYLSSKPSNWVPSYEVGWRDRYDWNGYDGKFGRYPGNRRQDDRLYVPYQIGIGRSNDDQETWGQYGGSYGGVESYYKDRTDYANSLSHWGLTSERPNFIPRPFHFDYHNLGKKLNHRDNYGYGYNWRRNHSGSHNGLGYDHFDEKPKVHICDAEDRSDDGGKDCTSRRRPGMSLGSGAIRRALLARNVVECESACFNEQEFKCVSYSYRYSHSHGTDNCFLSERPYRGLELSADSGSDVYAMPQHSSCAEHTKPWVESECFWHVRSGASVYGAASRAALTVAGLGACEAECIRAHSFFCRGFSFRYDSPTIGDDIENCILTSSPPTSLDIGKGLKPTAGHELYSRGNYGRGCEPALYDDNHHKETQCYLQYDNTAKLIGASIRGQARVKDELACGVACTEAPFRCLSYSYNKHSSPTEDNCLLSEVRLFDLQRGVDYEHSNEHLLFAFDLFNSQCWRKVHGKTYETPAPELPLPIPAEEHYPGWNSPSPGYSPQPAEPPFSPGSGPPSGPGYKPSYLPDIPEKPYLPSGPGPKPGYIPSGPEEPPYRPESNPGFISEPGHRPSYGPGYKPSGPPYLPGPHYPGPIGHEKPYPCSSCDNYPESKPLYPESGFQPGFTIDPHRPDYIEPSGPNYPGRPSGPSYPGPPRRPSGPSYPAPPLRPSGPNYPLLPERPSGPNYPLLPERPSGPNYPSGPSYSGGPSGPSYPGSKPDVSVEPGLRPGYGGPSGPGPQGGRPDDREIEPIAVSWSHYTVSGFPCRKGTTCAQNQVAGHWACEPEGGEIGSWDYCCAPTHRCGYSEGFHKPWCYVGRADDQWRPCSEKYYPYHQHNVPHPSQGHREIHRPNRPWRPSGQYIDDRDKPSGPYLSEADRKYWDDLYKNGPKAYYDKYGDPLPGYIRVPPVSRPHIKYRHNYPPPNAGQWAPAELDPPLPGGLGAPRFWPVAYLHKSPPPNMTYFRYNETRPTTEKYKPIYDPNYDRKYDPIPVTPPRANPPPEFKKLDTEKPNGIEFEITKHRDEKTRNITNVDSDIFDLIPQKETTTVKLEPKVTTTTEPVKEIVKNVSDVETIDPVKLKADQELANLKGIDDKLEDFSKSIEVLNIEDAKSGEKSSDLKTLEAEERQIEAIGRLFASRRGGKIVLEKRSQKELEAKSIAIDKDYANVNFGSRPTTERRGIIQKVTKDDIEKELNANINNDRSLEVSETTYVRPPRVLSTTDNVRKAIVNGKIFYDATVRDQREILHNVTRRPKNLRPLEERAPSVINNNNYGRKKVIRARNVNPVRRVRRVYRRKYNPEEVRRRLLEREKNLKLDNEQKKQ